MRYRSFARIHGSRIVVRLEDRSEGRRVAPFVSGTPPPAVTGFDCIAINIVGPGIPDTSKNPEANLSLVFDRLLQRQSYCSYRGILAGPLSTAVTTPQEIAMIVPPGDPRLIQVVGFKEQNGSNDCIREFDPSVPAVIGPSGVPVEADVYEIGRAVVGLFVDTTVSINSDWGGLSAADQALRILNCGNNGPSPSPSPFTALTPPLLRN